jgi:hypothetical protein
MLVNVLNKANGTNTKALLEHFNQAQKKINKIVFDLIKDGDAIYAIGFYQKEAIGYADLILVSKRGAFESILEKVSTKTFNCKKGVDFGTAAGLQVDSDGKLHIWATQRDALQQIAVNRFSQRTE